MIVLVAALAIGTGLRAAEMSGKRQLNHDEAISYIAATGHEDRYRWAIDGGLTNRWVPAADWKRLMQPGSFWDFGEIRAGLAHTDTHPPLYFWLLHVWVAVVGVHLRGGIVLNILIALGTGVVLFLLAWRLLRDPLEAALVVLVWETCAPMLKTSLIARHYDLYAFFTALLAFVVVGACDLERPWRRRDYVFLALVAAAGLLTHYQFVIVVGTAVLYAIVFLVRRDRGRLLRVVAGLVAAAPLFLLGAPQFYESVRRQSQWQAHGFSLDALRSRAQTVGDAMTSLYGLREDDLRRAPAVASVVSRPLWGPLANPVAVLAVALAAIGLVLVVGLALPRTRRPVRRWLGRIDRTGVGRTLVLLGGVAGGIIGMYLAFRSPVYAMQERYLAPIWVPAAFIPVLLARLLIGRARYVVVVAFVAFFMLPASLGRLDALKNPAPDRSRLIESAARVVVDRADRSNTSRLLYWLPDHTPVYVSSQAELAARPDAWLPKLTTGDLYLELGGEQNTPQSFAAVKRLIDQRFTMMPRHYGLRGVGLMFVLRELAQPATAAP